MKSKDSLPEVHFGEINDKPIDWRKANLKDTEDDDELLDETPDDVIDLLGFDPREFLDDEEE
jgi:hypothetical protein